MMASGALLDTSFAKSDPKDATNEPRILAGAHVSHVVFPAWKDVIVERTTSPFKPRDQRFARGLDEFELHRPLCRLLHYNRAISDGTAGDDVTDADLTTSHPRSLLSIAKSKMARSRRQRC